MTYPYSYPIGSSSGDLSGSYPNPVIAALTGVAGVINAKTTTLEWQQGGTVGAPANLYALQFTPTDATKSKWKQSFASTLFHSTEDTVSYMGWNWDGADATRPRMYIGMESDYEVSVGVHWFEWYVQFLSTDASYGVRPFYANFNFANNSCQVILQMGANAADAVTIQDGNSTTYWTFAKTQTDIGPATLQWYPGIAPILTQQPPASDIAPNYMVVQAASAYAAATVNYAGADLVLGGGNGATGTDSQRGNTRVILGAPTGAGVEAYSSVEGPFGTQYWRWENTPYGVGQWAKGLSIFNWVLLSNGGSGDVYLNAPGRLHLQAGAGDLGTWDATYGLIVNDYGVGVNLGVTVQLAGAVRALGVQNGVGPSSTPPSGFVMWSESGVPFYRTSGQVGGGTHDVVLFLATSASATAGSNGLLPAQVALYVEFEFDGVAYKIPCYNV